MAGTGDNECAYSGKYDPLKTIFDCRCYLGVCVKNMKSMQVLE